jgi:hypothetical protein
VDTNETATARIARVDSVAGPPNKIGVEILDNDDLWHLKEKAPQVQVSLGSALGVR